MPTHGHDPSALPLLLVVLGACGPWLAGIAWAIRRRPRDGSVPLSLGERARRRL